jgi:predicted amidohydrolase
LAIDEIHPDPLSVAVAQLAPVFGDLDGNRAQVADAINSAALAGAELVVLPELCVTGYAFADESQARELGEPADGPTLRQWRELADQHGIVIVGGFCELDGDGRPRNSAAVVDPGGVRCVYRKTHLWDREQLIFLAGSEPPPIVDTGRGRIGVAICYDAFFPELMRMLALGGADVIAVPMNSPLVGEPTEPLQIELVLALAAAHVNGVFVAQADRAGAERGIEWAQASVICDPSGRMLAGPQRGAALLRADCDLTAARDKSLGERNDVLADRRAELYVRGPSPLLTGSTDSETAKETAK